MRKLLAMLCMLCSWGFAAAQDVRPWDDYFGQTGQLEDVESESWAQTYDDLEELHANKLDLNRCTREDLRRLPFLSEQQIMDLLEYRDRARRIESTVELRLVPSLERRDVDLLLQFAEIVPEERRDSVPTLRGLLRHGRHDLTATLKVPVYTRRGDADGYLGYKYKHWLRYAYTAGQHLKVGLVASQDAGEPFFSGRNSMGYDFYSAFLLLRDLGRVKALAVGRYRLRMGMGLILNNALGLGKLNTLSTLGRSGNYVSAHSSRSEANYLQGAAATVTVARGLDVTAFVSWRRVDATLNADSSSVATLLRTGYHRTESEMRRRRNTSQWVTGGNVNYFNHGFHVGVTGLYTAFNRVLRPDISQAFRRWYPQGDRFWNISTDYGYVSGRLTIAGETATGTRGAVATINSVSYQVASNLSVMVLQRYYPYQFCALFGESYADGGQVSNESGVYVGCAWAPRRGLSLQAYADVAYFAWPKYQASAPSHSFDHFVQATYERHDWSILARYRLRVRERDNDDKTALGYRYEHRGRMSAGYDNGTWSARGQADLSYTAAAGRSVGYMVSGNGGYRGGWLRLQATVGYFHTDDYDSRVYVYEPGTLYNLSFASFYGEGLRCALSARADLGRRLMAMVKVGTTRYFDRDTIGSGLQEVRARGITDVEVQLRVRW